MARTRTMTNSFGDCCATNYTTTLLRGLGSSTTHPFFTELHLFFSVCLETALSLLDTPCCLPLTMYGTPAHICILRTIVFTACGHLSHTDSFSRSHATIAIERTGTGDVGFEPTKNAGIKTLCVRPLHQSPLSSIHSKNLSRR